MLITGGGDNTLRIWDLTGLSLGTVQVTWEGRLSRGNSLTCVARACLRATRATSTAWRLARNRPRPK